MRRTMMAAGLVALTVAGATTSPAHSSSTVGEQFRQCATKALRGEFGRLRPWQRNAYQRGLSGGVRCVTVWQTIYCPPQYRRGEGTAHGYGCDETIAAANALPGGTVVWIASPAHLRVIGDTGARGNDRVARRKGATLWLDLWLPYRGWRGVPDSTVATVAVVGGAR